MDDSPVSSLLSLDLIVFAPHPVVGTGLRDRLEKLAHQREAALERGDDATIALCDLHIIRCELSLAQVEDWQASRRVRST